MGLTQGAPVTPVGSGYVPVSKWYRDLWPSLPMCPNPAIRERVVDAAREFLKRTELWTVELEPIDIEAGKAEYVVKSALGDMVSLDHYEIKDSQSRYNRKAVISEIAVDENPDEYDDWRSRQNEQPDAGWVGQTLKLRLTYIPATDIADGLKVWINIVPFEGALVVPKILWTHFRDAIKDGVLSNLLLMQDTPWVNLQLAGAHGSGFEEAILPARQQKFSGFIRHRTRDIIRTNYVDF